MALSVRQDFLLPAFFWEKCGALSCPDFPLPDLRQTAMERFAFSQRYRNQRMGIKKPPPWRGFAGIMSFLLLYHLHRGLLFTNEKVKEIHACRLRCEINAVQVFTAPVSEFNLLYQPALGIGNHKAHFLA